MLDSQQTRQQLYDRIKNSSKDEVILEEMIRLGFWKREENIPTLPEDLIHQKGTLQRQLQSLLEKQSLYNNKEKLLRQLRRERLEKSKNEREDRKLEKEKSRIQKTKQWKLSQLHDITYIGEHVSKGMSNSKSDSERLINKKLPIFESIESLAKSAGITVSELRFLTFARKTSKVSHYKRFLIAKKTGGHRLISAPMPRLKNLQYWVLKEILQPLETHTAVHGFKTGKSIVTNARVHTGSDVVINLDMKDFFPTVSYKRVKGMFRSFGYSEKIATILALVCTEPDIDEIALDTETYFSASSVRRLPQGAPTSPAITNIICNRLDKRLSGTAFKLGFRYTRYADDITFSISGEYAAQKKIQKILWQTRKILEDEGFVVHPDKLRVMKKGRRQEVTGVIVNEKLNIPRRDIKRFRALIFQIEKDGLEGKTWAGSKRILSAIRGYANFVKMVNPSKGNAFVARVKAISQKYNFRHQILYPKQETPKYFQKMTDPEQKIMRQVEELELQIQHLTIQQNDRRTQQEQQQRAQAENQTQSNNNQASTRERISLISTNRPHLVRNVPNPTQSAPTTQSNGTSVSTGSIAVVMFTLVVIVFLILCCCVTAFVTTP